MLVARQLDQNVAMLFGKRSEIMRLCRGEAFQRRDRRLQCRDQRLRLIELIVADLGSRLGAMQRGRLLAFELGEFVAKSVEVPREASAAGLRPRTAQQRQFERLDRAPEPPSSPPSRHSGCFSSASKVGGSSCFATVSAASRAKMPAGVSISESPPESSNSRFQRPSAAITRRASARSGVTSAADLARGAAPRASQSRSPAPPSRDWRPAITARLACRPRCARRSAGSRQPPMPLRGGVATAASLRRPDFAPVRRRSAQDFDIAALDAEPLQQRMHRKLRMVGRRTA